MKAINENEQIRIDPDITRYTNMQSVTEKPKEINLAEIVTSVLQEILSGKLNSLENIIGKLRIQFEEKNIFTNSKKNNIILLNFEDDTMRAVLKIEDKYRNIIQRWYDNCELLIDFEETDVSIPEVILTEDISGVIFQDINCKFKDEYLNVYLPLVFNNIISHRSIIAYEKKYFKKTNTTTYSNEKSINISKSIAGDKILLDMGIIIPENIKPDKIEPKINNNQTELFTGIINNINTRAENVDPCILVKKYILNDVNKEPLSNLEVIPYNTFYDIKNYNDSLPGFDYNLVPDVKQDNISLFSFNKPLFAYNYEYNTLYPSFSDNCSAYINIQENIKEHDVSSIFVLIHEKYLQTIIIENPDTDNLHIIKNHPEFGFIKLFGITTNNKDIVSFIEQQFNKTQFNDIDEINKKLFMTSQYIEFANIHNNVNNKISSEENYVKQFLNSKYTFDDDINHKMKASTLYDIIINSKVVKIENDKMSGFRTRLSKYLKDIGLKKKRYNDGFYYYGIVDRMNKFNLDNNSSTNKQFIEEIKKKRNDDFLSY